MRPPSHGITRELQVGIFIIAACLVVVAFSFRITDTPIFRQGTQLITYLDDATGVFRNSKVKMAGIDIGVIKEIHLENGRARLVLLINKGVEIPKNAHIVPRPLGILGDKYLEVVVPRKKGEGPPSGEPIQGTDEQDTQTPSASYFFDNFFISNSFAQEPVKKIGKENYREGEVIESQNDPATLDDITRQMGSVGADLKAVSKELRNIVENGGDSKSPLGKTLKNTENATQNLNEVLIENRKDLRELISGLKASSQKINQALEAVDTDQFKKDVRSLAKAAGNLSKSLENLEKVTSKIERGEGTLGRLVNSEKTVDQLDRALVSVNNLIDRSQRTRAIVELSSSYLTEYSDTRTVFTLGLFPREDSGYIGGVTSDPFGTRESTLTRTRVDGGVETTEEVVVQKKSAIKFSLQYYKRIWNFGLKVGVFENLGGFSFNYYAPVWDTELGFEAYDLSRQEDRPHLNFYLKQPFLTYFHASMGYYEALAQTNRTELGLKPSFNLGVGLRFSDEDLKTLTLFPFL